MTMLTEVVVRQIVREEIKLLEEKAEQKFDQLFASQAKAEQKFDQLFASQARAEQKFDQLFDLQAKAERRMDRMEEELHRQSIMAEDTKKTLDTVLEVVISMNDKFDRLDPLEKRVDQCEAHITVLNHAVKTHVADKKLPPTS